MYREGLSLGSMHSLGPVYESNNEYILPADRIVLSSSASLSFTTEVLDLQNQAAAPHEVSPIPVVV